MTKKRTKKISLALLIIIPLISIALVQGLLPLGILNSLDVKSTLETNAIDDDMHKVKTHAESLTTEMVVQWESISEQSTFLNAKLQELLDENHTDISTFLTNQELQTQYLSTIYDTFLNYTQDSTASGSFMILANDANTAHAATYNGFFLRDSDPEKRTSSNTDLLLTKGNTALAQQSNTALDVCWTTKFNFKGNGNRKSDNFFYQPYVYASKHTDEDVSRLGYWASPFVLEDNYQDNHKMITYSLPLAYEGKVYAVYGVEASLSYISGLLNESDLENGNSSYILALDKGDGSYDVLQSNGVLYSANIDATTLFLSSTDKKNLFLVTNDTNESQNIYALVSPLHINYSNSPYKDANWCIIGLVTEDSIFGLGEHLYSTITLAILACLILSLLIAVILFNLISDPVQKLMRSISHGREGLKSYTNSNIKEIDQLHDVIEELSETEYRQTEQLSEEKEGLQIAMTSTNDMFFTYDYDDDSLNIINFNGIRHIYTANDATYLQFIHPADRKKLLTLQKKKYPSFSIEVRYRDNPEAEYIFVRISGKSVGNKVIGSLRNINDKKILELKKEMQQILDATTLFYKYLPGLQKIQEMRETNPDGLCILLDIDHFHQINEDYGLCFGDILLEALTRKITTEFARLDALFIRSGPDRFLIWVHGSTTEEIQQRIATIQSYFSSPVSIPFLSFTTSIAKADENSIFEDTIAEVCATRDYSRKHGMKICEYDPTIPIAEVNFKSDEIASLSGLSDMSLSSLTLNLYSHTENISVTNDVLAMKIHEKYKIDNFLVFKFQRDYLSIILDYIWKDENHYPQHVKNITQRDLNNLMQAIGTQNILVFDENMHKNTMFSLIPKNTKGLWIPVNDNGNFAGFVLLSGIDPEVLHEEQAEKELSEFASIISSEIIKNMHDISAKAKSDFLARMSHEIRTPMNGIIGMTEIALNKDITEQQRLEYLEKVKVSSNYLLSLLNDILDMAKIDSGKMELASEKFNLDTLIADLHPILDTRFTEKKQTFEIHKNYTNKTFIGDKIRLSQILINLLGNANKYTQENGTISLTIQEEPHTDASTLTFLVSDNGIGISEEDQNRIFESFEQAHNTASNGTGLGLAISSRLAHMMGSRINLQSTLHKGSTFSFVISLKKAEEENLPQPQLTQHKTHFPHCKALVAEDNALNAEIITIILQSYGISVDIAKNGQEARDKFADSTPHYYDIIFMDIMMPIMNGLEATKAIRSLQREDNNIPIYAMSANAFVEDEKNSIAAGMNGHLSKPINTENLLEVLNTEIKK